MDFPQKFYEVPSLITTPKHKKVDIDADNMAVTEWTEVGAKQGDISFC